MDRNEEDDDVEQDENKEEDLSEDDLEKEDENENEEEEEDESGSEEEDDADESVGFFGMLGKRSASVGGKVKDKPSSLDDFDAYDNREYNKRNQVAK